MLKRVVIRGVLVGQYRVEFLDLSIEPRQVVVTDVSLNVFPDTLVIGAIVKVLIPTKNGAQIGSTQIVSVLQDNDWVPCDDTVLSCHKAKTQHMSIRQYSGRIGRTRGIALARQ